MISSVAFRLLAAGAGTLSASRRAHSRATAAARASDSCTESTTSSTCRLLLLLANGGGNGGGGDDGGGGTCTHLYLRRFAPIYVAQSHRQPITDDL